MCYKGRLYLVKEKEFKYNEKIKNPSDIRNFLVTNTSLACEPEEVLILINLNIDNTIINYFEVSRGAIDQTIACPREIVKRIILSNASKFVLAHNHPSGNLLLSKDDIKIYKTMKQVADLMEIELLDSIVINQNKKFSSTREKIEII
ncbi:DNA repair protein RadC [Thomasclavelia cocleata]|uniref:DNA repair protein RadC n=1 Tax=Thomasclavelia cocleata TaxID=69824 RepID=A0A1I0BH35_9FIRM|nr:JAB domain-containing protein [Thomasclavelia cocleata]MCR1960244.1 JAB domain-containing protein [Thomasclavelia cocleata]NDO41782.1 DNA repair protein RadC [Thomasclavelia cocleata]PJN79854.1 DNA repair protein RadC [Thomasclavelia cocleata]SET06205.1 DNA repair protein RadC [Thomasclavelia cocleata]